MWSFKQVAGAVSQLLGHLCQPSMLLADSRSTPGSIRCPWCPCAQLGVNIDAPDAWSRQHSRMTHFMQPDS